MNASLITLPRVGRCTSKAGPGGAWRPRCCIRTQLQAAGGGSTEAFHGVGLGLRKPPLLLPVQGLGCPGTRGRQRSRGQRGLQKSLPDILLWQGKQQVPARCPRPGLPEGATGLAALAGVLARVPWGLHVAHLRCVIPPLQERRVKEVSDQHTVGLPKGGEIGK